MFGDKKKILGKSYLLVLLSIGYWPAEETDSLWKALFPVNTSGAGSSDRGWEEDPVGFPRSPLFPEVPEEGNEDARGWPGRG